MKLVLTRLASASFAILPFAMMAWQGAETKPEPTCEQVFKNIQAFKGKPASELLPAMDFMSASLQIECTGCHDGQDFAKDTEMKQSARAMIAMQSDIDEKHFGGRLRVTCMTCHRGSEHPVGLPLPPEVRPRPDRMANPPSVADVLAKAKAATGAFDKPLVRSGSMTAPNDATHKIETNPVVFIQDQGGKFSMVSQARQVISNGSETWYDGNPMSDEPKRMFERLGRNWMNPDALAIDDPRVTGTDKVDGISAIVVSGTIPGAKSREQLYFSEKSGQLLRVVIDTPSLLGTVVNTLEFSAYKSVDGQTVPMKMQATFAGGLARWTFDFKSAKTDPSINDATFKPAK